MFNVCRMLTVAYRQAFNRYNIVNGFYRAGIMPFNPDKLVKNGLPKSDTELSTALSFELLWELLDARIRHAQQAAAHDESYKCW